ncbi:MAG: transposase [Oligoflexales bacterium]|nr:transposase [Oligoflexales bacterium]
MLRSKEKELGRKYKYPRRNPINAILYVVSNGVIWQDLSPNYPHWNSVY